MHRVVVVVCGSIYHRLTCSLHGSSSALPAATVTQLLPIHSALRLLGRRYVVAAALGTQPASFTHDVSPALPRAGRLPIAVVYVPAVKAFLRAHQSNRWGLGHRFRHASSGGAAAAPLFARRAVLSAMLLPEPRLIRTTALLSKTACGSTLLHIRQRLSPLYAQLRLPTLCRLLWTCPTDVSGHGESRGLHCATEGKIRNSRHLATPEGVLICPLGSAVL
ncbi:hypothetical protein K491DRAFT_725260 [Lophiostoma macrostomum CBS 122681]|uniref:Uncharacterized protein n=1 Tax=Lophiostoma macrostomum CBS 122681 TaxID=1314788 RepID=A0A6A6TLC5_9PLEO|nr:hypothetical protein K491DRAFT_725260 [Lophiostoma macrostomum CBS 122681]